jgi:hypothetical protein
LQLIELHGVMNKDLDAEGLPIPFPHIQAVFGEVIDMRFDTVDNVLYGVVCERRDEDEWVLIYAARVFGFERLWTFWAVDRDYWTNTMRILDDNVVGVAETEHDGGGTLVVTQEVDTLRNVMVFRFDEETDEWSLYLVLQFDLTTSINWAASDGSSTSTTVMSESP